MNLTSFTDAIRPMIPLTSRELVIAVMYVLVGMSITGIPSLLNYLKNKEEREKK